MFFLDSILKLLLEFSAVSVEQTFHFLGFDEFVDVYVPLLQSLKLGSNRLEVFVFLAESFKVERQVKLINISTVLEVLAFVFNPGKVL